MKIIKKIFTLVLCLVLMTLLAACNNTTSMSIQEHYENNRYIYEELANKTNSKNGAINFTVRENSLVLTATVSITVKDNQIDLFGKVLEDSINNSDKEYYEVLENIREDVPEATFIVEYVDNAGTVIASKEYK